VANVGPALVQLNLEFETSTSRFSRSRNRLSAKPIVVCIRKSSITNAEPFKGSPPPVQHGGIVRYPHLLGDRTPACRALGQSRNTHRRKACVTDDDPHFVKRIVGMASEHGHRPGLPPRVRLPPRLQPHTWPVARQPVPKPSYHLLQEIQPNTWSLPGFSLRVRPRLRGAGQ